MHHSSRQARLDAACGWPPQRRPLSAASASRRFCSRPPASG